MTYKDQIAVAVLEGKKTRNRATGHEVRQGCPLSPLIFDLGLKPLAIASRTDNVIQGIQQNILVIKMGLYVCNIVCYLSNPVMSIRALCGLIEEFWPVSGYWVNQDKSVLFGFHITEPEK